ncbi:hypothetical protein L6164_010847 [Bauhinia variegata]|uniref:Uncharacterized protein n=1 Tax=Bauhinia variegata TaxID=167791 RepID=A0ACB9P4L2_BAUVA|nr:hypothetical protein L6164_010847 [Bauhinia variegata]
MEEQDIKFLCKRKGGNRKKYQTHKEWCRTVQSQPDVISMSFIPITSLLGGINGSGFLTHAINLYLRYKPPVEELHQFLEFQIPRHWAPVFGELALGPERKAPNNASLQFSFMGPKLYVNTTPVDVDKKPVTGLRLYLEGKKSNCLAIHLQHLSSLPMSLLLEDELNESASNASSEHKYYEKVQWKSFSHVCTAPVESDEDNNVVTGAYFQVGETGLKKVLFLRLHFSKVVRATSVKRTEWDGSPGSTQKSGIISTIITTRFSTPQKPPPQPSDVNVNSAVYPGGPPVPTQSPKLLRFVDTTEMTRGPQNSPGYWLVSGARLFVDKAIYTNGGRSPLASPHILTYNIQLALPSLLSVDRNNRGSVSMPLLKRKLFVLAEPPKDLETHELVYQVRFTKEIFRDYHNYLNRMNLYRQRVWMCKVTGKTGLTYEEALLSEKRATEKVQQFPKELIPPALRIIQYSMLSLKDLADAVAAKLQERLFVGAELYGKKDDDVHPCRILKVIEEGVDKFRYEVAWLDKNRNIIGSAQVSAKELVQKKQPFSRNMLKSFIRESTHRNVPWVLHDELARNYGISTDIPEELRGQIFFRNGLLVCNKKRKNEELKGETEKCKRKKSDARKVDGSNTEEENDQLNEEPVKYPIDDLLVKPSPDDPVFTERPSPSRDFNVPIYCVGDLLMVWDFCTSFGRLLHLSPYSLEDFENAICHKESNVVLLVESHAALLRLLIKDRGEFSSAVENKNRKSKITMITWTDYLCDFLEMIKVSGLRQYEATIKRGHYGLVDAHAKLEILCELVNRALETVTIREQLDDFIEQRQVLGATRRGEAIEDARKRREHKERLKAEPDSNGSADGHLASISENDNHSRQNGDVEKKRNGEIESSGQKDALDRRSGIENSNPGSKKKSKKLSSELKEPAENGKESQKPLKGDKDLSYKTSIEQRREHYEREMEKRFIRTNPLGKDRYHNKYWWFRRDGRIFVESPESKEWGYYGSKEELDALMGSLNCKGERERALQKQVEKYYGRICSELQKRSRDLTNKIALDESVVRRSTRVRAPPRENPANAFLRYVNKWKEE